MSFLFALGFLTIFPIATRTSVNRNKLSSSTIYFPLVGLLLGLILAATNMLLSYVAVSAFLSSVMLVTLLAIVTGALHLDGLADTADAFLSRKTAPEMLKIMRDSQVGAMGVLSLIFVILLKISLLYSLNPETVNTSLILMCLLSRYALVLAISVFTYAREEGKAKVFIEAKSWKSFVLASTLTLFCAFAFLGLKGIALFVLVILSTLLIGKFVTKKIGGITGDILGAINELSEVVILFGMFILNEA